MGKHYKTAVVNFLEGDILPGKGIGEAYLGWNIDRLHDYLQTLNLDYGIEDRANSTLVITRFAMFWISKESKSITQILVFGEFRGKLMGCIGIGATLKDVQAYIGNWEKQSDVYIIPQYPGVCLELKDVEDYDEEWDEAAAPIENISVFIY